MYQLRLHARRNSSCRELLQKLLLLAWGCSSHQLSIEHSPGHTSPADMLEDLGFSLLDHQDFQLQMLRAYSGGLEKRAAAGELHLGIAVQTSWALTPSSTQSYHKLCDEEMKQLGESAAGAVR